MAALAPVGVHAQRVVRPLELAVRLVLTRQPQAELVRVGVRLGLELGFRVRARARVRVRVRVGFRVRGAGSPHW